MLHRERGRRVHTALCAVVSPWRPGLPFISVITDPTYGGVSASYAMQGDVRIGVNPKARVGFAGPSVILNTVYGMDQGAYDSEVPVGFQSTQWLMDKGPPACPSS